LVVNRKSIPSLSDEQILATRICDIRIPIKEVPLLNRCYVRLREELKRQRLLVAPMLWVADEWYSPDGVCGFAVPFFLLHPRLIRLAEEKIYEAEGSEREWCMRLMRHEMGHVMDNAYQLRRRRQRQKLFGLSSLPYPDSYSPQPYSKKFVKNLDSWYAQAHPDEDWAETFAVWLNPQSKWRQKYKSGVARQKLDYLDEVMKSLAGTRPVKVDRTVDIKASDMKMTVGEFFDEKRSDFDEDEVGFFDEDLKRIFSFEKDPRAPLTAERFIRNHRLKLRDPLSKWTGQDRYKIKFIMDHLCERCKDLKLFLRNNPEDTLLEVTAMLAAKTASFLATGKYRISL
jgi:hypothetical protein